MNKNKLDTFVILTFFTYTPNLIVNIKWDLRKTGTNWQMVYGAKQLGIL